MRYSKMFAWLALAGGMVFAGASTASAQDWRDLFRDRNDIRKDYYREDAMEQHLAADRARLNEDIRCGRSDAAARDAADLARDQQRFQNLRRDVRYDRQDMRDDYRNDYYRQGSYGGYRYER